jgi:HK97 family phage portal protein
VNLLRRRNSEEDRALTTDTSPNEVLGAPDVLLAGSTVAAPVGVRGALRLVDVWACVNVIASVASTLPLIAYRRSGAGRERLVGGRLIELLRSPAPAVTQANLIGQTVASLAARGNAYLGLYSNAEGGVEQLGVIDPERVQVQIVAGAPRYLLTHLDGTRTVHDETEIVHIRMPMTFDGVVGMSPIAQCGEALGLNKALAEEASATAVNASTPKGVLTVAQRPGADDVAENLRAQWNDRHQSARNRGRVAVLTSDVSFTGVSISPHDSLLVERQRLSTVEIARIFNVPPSMLNAPSNDSLTYATTETQAAAFAKFCLQPYLTAVEQAVTNSPLCGALVYVEFLLDALLRPDALVRSQVYTAALGNPQTGSPGWMTRAEIRERESLPPETQPEAA